MASVKFAVPFLFLATVPLGFRLGGAWSFLTLGLMAPVICGFDHLLGFEDTASPAEDDPVYRAMVIVYVGLQLAVTVWAGSVVAERRPPLLQSVGLALSVGVTTGVFGMLAAHELSHSRSALERTIGLMMLAATGYMHFPIAHLHGHHVRGATPADPASARRGESAYAFVVRSVAGQLREAWAFETERLRRRGRNPFGPRNRILVFLVVELAGAAALATASPSAFGFWALQAAVAVLMLELFNYIAHYGLERRRLANGRYERLGPQHCWNSSRRMNNWALFNMGRHADHHRRPTQSYQGLAPEGPELPTGYAGAILLALVPPLWRRVMDPRVEAVTRAA